MLPLRTLSLSGRRWPAGRTSLTKAGGVLGDPRVQAMAGVLAAGIGSFGLGAGTAAVAHVLNRRRPVPGSDVETEIHLPYPQPRTKAAADPTWTDAVKFLAGHGAKSPVDVPWALPAGALATAGGAVLGNSLVRGHFRNKRKAELQAQLDAAQKEYEAAMLAQYDRSRLHKLGASRWRTTEGVNAIQRRLPGVAEPVPTAAATLDALTTGPANEWPLARLRRSEGLAGLLRATNPVRDRDQRNLTLAAPGRMSAIQTQLQGPHGEAIRGVHQRAAAMKQQRLLDVAHRRAREQSPAGHVLRDVGQDIQHHLTSGFRVPQDLIDARRGLGQELRSIPRPTQLGPQPKTASALDRLCDAFEKHAVGGAIAGVGPPQPPPAFASHSPSPPPSGHQLSGAHAGALMALSALLATGAAVGTKSYLDSRSKHKLLQDALKHRAMLRQSQNPPDVYVRPVPAPEEAAGP